MNSPATDARRFLSACALGFVLGIFYGALRPMRRRFPRTADLFFCAALVPAWLYLSCALCRGDLRLGYTFGLFAGKAGLGGGAGRIFPRMTNGVASCCSARTSLWVLTVGG